MKDYFSSLEIERDVGFGEFKAALTDLRRKWVYRINQATNAQKRSEAEIKVDLINEALVAIKDSASLDQYRFELNNSPSTVDSSTQNDGDNKEYETDLRIANGFFADEDYSRAFEKANAILASGKRTADVYELVMLSLNKLNRHAESVTLGVDAIQKYGCKELKVFRALVFAYEKEDNHKKAYDILMQLKSTLPNDINADFFIAQMMMEHLGNRHNHEARGYLDNLLANIDLLNNPDITKWDVQLVFVFGNSFPLLVSKIAAYSSGKYAQNKEFVRKTKGHFQNVLDIYAKEKYQEFENYFLSTDVDRTADIDVCCQIYDICYITKTLANAKGTNKLWSLLDGFLQKYRTQKVADGVYSVLERFTKLCIQELPTYKDLVNYNAESLKVENDADYDSISALLNPLSEIQKKNSNAGINVDRLLEDVENVHNYAIYKRNIGKNLGLVLLKVAVWAAIGVAILLVSWITGWILLRMVGILVLFIGMAGGFMSGANKLSANRTETTDPSICMQLLGWMKS